MRSCDGDSLPGKCPVPLQSRAAYSNANTVTAPALTAVNSIPNRASNSGTDARIIVSTSMMMTQTISWAKREPTELGD